ncbi:pyridoxal phosphate-dependent decarboxylase family protein [Leifsonia sp. NPDC102414]|uniref:pyridoxal phosphate-dependent decarboxylase family protein n=1 Tax=Leifsonia sp. NPDC102414 TaxID=3364124 RepID=UPI003820A1FF
MTGVSVDDSFGPALGEASRLAERWLDGVRDGSIPATATIDQVKDALGRSIPERGDDATTVLRRMGDAIEPGLLRMHSPRFHGWVIGGAHPVALAADWLVSAWDQNATLRTVTPGVVAAEELAGEWIVELLGLPPAAEAGFVTGATMANFVGIVTARDHVLREAGWDVASDGLSGGPRVRFVAGAERHGSLDEAGRFAGLGAAQLVDADDEGRMRVDALRETLAAGDGPTIVCLQAGNVHSGAFDPIADAVAVAHAAGAWVHIDGAFGLWAAASPRLRHLTEGMAAADSWATDAHKTLNVPYDCGIAIVAHPELLHASFAQHAAYLTATEVGSDPNDRVPELSRRARGVPAYAALAQLGRHGVAELVERLADAADELRARLSELPEVRILNDVVFTQVCATFGSDERTRAVTGELARDGVAFGSPSHWHGRDVLRFSVSNWLTDRAEARRTAAAVADALTRIP